MLVVPPPSIFLGSTVVLAVESGTTGVPLANSVVPPSFGPGETKYAAAPTAAANAMLAATYQTAWFVFFFSFPGRFQGLAAASSIGSASGNTASPKTGRMVSPSTSVPLGRVGGVADASEVSGVVPRSIDVRLPVFGRVPMARTGTTALGGSTGAVGGGVVQFGCGIRPCAFHNSSTNTTHDEYRLLTVRHVACLRTSCSAARSLLKSSRPRIWARFRSFNSMRTSSLNGSEPVRISKYEIASEYWSEAGSTTSTFLVNCSGGV